MMAENSQTVFDRLGPLPHHLTCDDLDDWRIPRLMTVWWLAQQYTEFPMREEVNQLHDHEGCLTVTWRRQPSACSMRAVVSAWEAVNECQVEHVNQLGHPVVALPEPPPQRVPWPPQQSPGLLLPPGVTMADLQEDAAQDEAEYRRQLEAEEELGDGHEEGPVRPALLVCLPLPYPATCDGLIETMGPGGPRANPCNTFGRVYATPRGVRCWACYVVAQLQRIPCLRCGDPVLETPEQAREWLQAQDVDPDELPTLDALADELDSICPYCEHMAHADD